MRHPAIQPLLAAFSTPDATHLVFGASEASMERFVELHPGFQSFKEHMAQAIMRRVGVALAWMHKVSAPIPACLMHTICDASHMSCITCVRG